MKFRSAPLHVAIPQTLLARIVRPDVAERPKAANDNEVRWPLFPFPEGWDACC
jgi:hypothetical protein